MGAAITIDKTIERKLVPTMSLVILRNFVFDAGIGRKSVIKMNEEFERPERECDMRKESEEMLATNFLDTYSSLYTS